MRDTVKNITTKDTGNIKVISDTLHNGEIPGDSIVQIPSVAVAPPAAGVPVREGQPSLSSSPWIVTVLLLLFVLLSIRFKNNFRFIKAMLGDLLIIRHRKNMFDDTVRETSFLITLDTLCTAETAIVIMQGIRYYFSETANIPPGRMLLICMLCTGTLFLFLLLAYNITGWIFSDRESTRLWVRSFGICQGLTGIALFPVTLALIFNPGCTEWMLWVGAAIFIIARIVFIFNGFRIFFTNFSLKVLFLYYLCSVEVIPFLLTAISIYKLCGI